jgi:general secretion pathway protein J
MNRPRAGRAAGFTLLELLVAITLLGLLMTALFGGLRLGARVWEVSEQRLDDSARLQVVQDFLRERLMQAHPLDLVDAQGRTEPAFIGLPQTVRFLTLMPEHLGAGFHLAQLGLIEEDGGLHLGLRWRSYDIYADDPEGEPHARVLLEDVAALELAYYGLKTEEQAGAWHDEWQGETLLPRLIRVAVIFAEGDRRHWPELIVPLVIDQTFDPGF